MSILLCIAKVTKYLKPREAAEALGVNVRMLVRWEKDGIIQAIKTPSGQRRYDLESYAHKPQLQKVTVLSCRVSSAAQKPDLNRQDDILAILHCFSSRLYGLRKYKTQIEKDPELCNEPSKQN